MAVNTDSELEGMCKDEFVSRRFRFLFHDLAQETKENHGKLRGIIGSTADIQSMYLPSTGHKLYRLRQRAWSDIFLIRYNNDRIYLRTVLDHFFPFPPH
jgi:hypothetical protein